jgi:hypothetical protein
MGDKKANARDGAISGRNAVLLGRNIFSAMNDADRFLSRKMCLNMEPHVLIVLGAGCGKTPALLSLIDSVIDVRPRAFVSFSLDAVIDGQRRVQAILDGLDGVENGPSWYDFDMDRFST